MIGGYGFMRIVICGRWFFESVNWTVDEAFTGKMEAKMNEVYLCLESGRCMLNVLIIPGTIFEATS